ncbi:MAG: hypothetical protein QW275_00365 [Candidatus Anstonellaceae archaeon]
MKKLVFVLAFLLILADVYPVACISYDEDCSSNPQGCCPGLICNTFSKPSGSSVQKCTQPDNICTNQPKAWVSPFAGVAGSPIGYGPYNATVDLQEGRGTIGAASPIYKVGWFSDWKSASLIGIMVAIGIIAIAAMIGHSFNLSEVKAFANRELMQAVVSALLIFGIMGAIIFFDSTARMAIEAGGLPVACNPDEPCYISAAKQYLQNIYDVAKESAENSLKESFESQKIASTGMSIQFNIWQLAFAGSNTRWNAGYSIKAERAMATFETVSRLMVSIYAQKYFIEVISFAIAPIFLLLGIILRTFFFTRKLGGLMLAIAVSLFIVYPLTFAFAWYTLNVTVYGERALSVSDPACPSECNLTYPVAFYVNDAGEIVQFRTMQEILRAGINSSNWNSGEVRDKNGNLVATYNGLVACKDLGSIGIGNYQIVESGVGEYDNKTITGKNKNWKSNQWIDSKLELDGMKYTIIGNDKNSIKIAGGPSGSKKNVPYQILKNILATGCSDCPDYCREVPFPANLPGCNISACSDCNAGCKIMRQRSDCPSKCTHCQQECIIRQPVENKCYIEGNSKIPADLGSTCEGCDGCPNWCKIVYQNSEGDLELIYKDQEPCKIPACKPVSLGGTCPEKCMYITKLKGETTSCEDLCTHQGTVCPKYCRIANASYVNQTYDISPEHSIMESCMTGAVGEACKRCPEGCKIQVKDADNQEYLENCAPFPKVSTQISNCEACPVYCRFTKYEDYSDAGSKTPLERGEVPGVFAPVVCIDDYIFGLKCDGTACQNNCKGAYPPLCLAYDSNSQLQKYCRKCPEEARVVLKHTNLSGQVEYGLPPLASSVACNETQCSHLCRNFEVEVPSQASNPVCKDYNATSGTCTQQTVFQNVCGCYPGIDSDLKENIGPNIPLAGDCSPPCDNQHWCNTATSTCVACNPQCEQGYRCTPNGCVPEHSCPPGQVWECRNVPVVTTVCNPDYTNCQRCPIKCRVSFSNPSWLDTTVCTQEACFDNCDSSCKATITTSSPQLCMEYIGNGEGDIEVPINERDAPYNERDGCKQCPENCRIKYWNPQTSSYEYYEGSCGITKNNIDPSTGDSNVYVDCTLQSCPATCRTEVPKPSQIGICKPSKLSQKPCVGCNALCRRTPNSYPPMPPSCNPPCGANQYCDISKNPPQCEAYPGSGSNCPQQCKDDEYCDEQTNKCTKKYIANNCPEMYCGEHNPETGLGCTDECKLPDPPSRLCESCVECPTDCLYAPATRTDCSEVCTEEALAGPLNIGPSDFIKKLPGAQGESDVKNVGVLMIPALVLPMFCIVIVIAFIRVLSPILGGDMDIPGIGRII